jgi:hypothetical protein
MAFNADEDTAASSEPRKDTIDSVYGLHVRPRAFRCIFICCVVLFRLRYLVPLRHAKTPTQDRTGHHSPDQARSCTNSRFSSFNNCRDNNKPFGDNYIITLTSRVPSCD